MQMGSEVHRRLRRRPLCRHPVRHERRWRLRPLPHALPIVEGPLSQGHLLQRVQSELVGAPEAPEGRGDEAGQSHWLREEHFKRGCDNYESLKEVA